MGKYAFITGQYESDGSISVYAKDESSRKRRIKVTGFEPYFHVPQDIYIPDDRAIERIEGDFTSVYGDTLKRITMETPSDVKHFRYKFDKHYEADIPFVRRFLIDTGIRNGFEVPDGKKIVSYKDLVPVDFSQPPLVCFLDIEVYCSTRFPNPSRENEKVICATLFDTEHKKYITILLDQTSGEKETVAPGHDLIRVTCEANLLMTLKKYLEWINPDALTGWNINFDIDYLVERSKRHEIHFNFDGICIFDLLSAYKRLHKKGGNRLKEVVISEGLSDEVVSEEFHSEWWVKDKNMMVKYNKADVEYCVELDKKFRLVEFYWGLKNYAGLEDLKGTLYAGGVLVDILLLRKYSGKFVLPSKVKREEGEDLSGALITSPEAGLYDDVYVFDMSKYYPNIVISRNLTPERTGGELGMVPKLCLELLDERKRYDKVLSETPIDTPEYHNAKRKRDNVKFIGEAVIGYFGSLKSRLYNPDLFDEVTTTGQRGLKFLKEATEKMGFKVLYTDTDGLVVKVPKERAKELLLRLNESLKQFCASEGIKGDLRIKIDRFCKRILFTGVKKRYAAWVVEEGGKPCDYTYIVGFEFVRRDASEVTRKLQKRVFDLLLKGDVNEVVSYIRSTIKDMKKGKYSLNQIAIPKTLNKSLEDYGKGKGGGIPDYVRGTLYSNKYFGTDIRGGDMIRMLYVNRIPGHPRTNVVCFLDEDELPVKPEVDWNKMVSRTVRMKIEKIIELAGLHWAQVEGTRSLLEVLG